VNSDLFPNPSRLNCTLKHTLPTKLCQMLTSRSPSNKYCFCLYSLQCFRSFFKHTSDRSAWRSFLPSAPFNSIRRLLVWISSTCNCTPSRTGSSAQHRSIRILLCWRLSTASKICDTSVFSRRTGSRFSFFGAGTLAVAHGISYRSTCRNRRASSQTGGLATHLLHRRTRELRLIQVKEVPAKIALGNLPPSGPDETPKRRSGGGSDKP